MRLSTVPLAFLLVTPLAAQDPGGGSAPRASAGGLARSALKSPNVGPQGSNWVFPAAFKNQMGNWNNRYPFGQRGIRYQQVGLGSELTKQGVWRALALRQPSTTFGRYGGRVQLTILLGRTTYDHNTLTTNFQTNANSGPMDKVADQKWFNVPNLGGYNTDPTKFVVVFPFDKPHAYAPAAGKNVLVEFVNTTNTGHLYSYLDAVGTGNTTRRTYALTPNATTGVSYQSGLVICLVDNVQSQADFGPFGKGCAGTGGSAGTVLPAVMNDYMGNTQNIFGHSQQDQRYQQVFLGSEMGTAKLLNGHSFRRDERATTGGGPIQIEVLMSNTTAGPATLSTTFSANPKGTQTTVLAKKTVNTPTLPGNINPRDFSIRIPWTTPWPWVPKPGENVLFENRNHDATRQASNWYDAHGGAMATGRIWGTPVTAAFASGQSTDYGLVIKFLHGGVAASSPLLGNVGRPVLGKSLNITLWDAKPTTAAILLFGFSNKNWGTIPLPLDMTLFGAAGCFLNVSFDLIFGGAATDAKGNGQLSYTVPNVPALDRARWHHQWLVIDAANGLGIVFSNGGSVRVGQQ